MRGNASRIASTRSDSGTVCSTPPFMRSPGITHCFLSKSISLHVAFSDSPRRAAVRIVNSIALATASEPRIFDKKSGTSANGMAS